MRQRGRIGRGQLSVISNLEAHARYVQAPSNLPQAERDLFNKVVQSMPVGFFQNSDCPLLESFVQATLSADCYVATLHNDPFNEEVQKLWDRAVRLQIALATKLRLTPHSRIGPKTPARQQANPPIQTFNDRVRAGQHAEPEEDEAS